ncbi:MAG TPA: M12 family metallo-peptidase [Phycisphaerales bacterium]|nr:M12 family metallo-peptidase [Phycisphaerales bacterium]
MAENRTRRSSPITCTMGFLLTALCGQALAAGDLPWTGELLTRSTKQVPAGFTALSKDPAAAEALKTATDALLVALPLSADLAVDVALTRIEVFTDDAKIVEVSDAGERELPRPDVANFSGKVLGHDDSHVFLSVCDNWVYGYATVDDVMYIISTGPATDPQPPVVYRPDQVSAEDLAIVIPPCSVGPEHVIKEASARPLGDGFGTRAGPCRVAKVAWDSDYELAQKFGADGPLTTAYITLVNAAMTDIYLRDVNTRIVTPYVRVFTTSNDPWTAADSGGRLNEFRSHWITKMLGVSRNLAHHLSGAGLGGGVAWVGTVCNTQYGYAVSGNLNGSFPYPLQDNRGINWDPYVVSHEMGHNFGTGHTHDSYTPPIDNCGNGNCSGAFAIGTIMSYCHLCTGGVQNIKLRFHPRCIDRILVYLQDEASCELADPAKFSKQPVSTTVDLGATAKFTTAVTAPGTVQFQWLHNGAELAGATSQNLTITGVKLSDVGEYQLRVSNECTTTFSNLVTLGVPCPSDFDGSGFVDTDDFDAFVVKFIEGDASTDFDGSGFVDTDDFDAFVQAFETGC